MSEKIANYLIITSADTHYLSHAVSDAIWEGWQPYGAPFALNGFCAQAVVKKEVQE